jgi:hypothetical protein
LGLPREFLTVSGRSGATTDDGASAPQPQYVLDFFACDGRLEPVKVFTQIGDAKLRRSLVRLIEELGCESDGYGHKDS